MREFEQYLNRLRAGLRLSASRADELVAEAESHLEARAAQWERMGRSRGEAAEAAMYSFGEPEEIARQLTRANQRHRLAGAFRSAAAFVTASVSLLLAFGLLDDSALWLRPVLQWMQTVPAWAQPAAFVLAAAVLTAPGAVLAGIIAGYRRWWLAALPVALLSLLCLVTAQWCAAAASLVAGLAITAPCGFAGSRALSRPTLATALAPVCVALLVGFALSELMAIGDAVGLLAAVAVTELVIGLLGLVAMWASRRAPRETLVWGAIGCAGSLLAMLLAVQHPFGGLGPEATWMGLVVAQTVFGAIVAWHYHVSRQLASEMQSGSKPTQ